MKINHLFFASKNIKILFFMLAFFMQVSCGFRPAYKADAYNENFLTFVEITPIRTIEGTNFYNHLKSIFPPAKKNLYVIANDLNPYCYEYLQLNAKVNRVENRLICWNMCAR